MDYLDLHLPHTAIFFISFWYFYFFPEWILYVQYWYRNYSVGSTSFILVLFVVSHYLTWAANFLRHVAGKFLLKVLLQATWGQLLCASVWGMIGPVCYN
jgi:hypothetical protein